MEINELYFLGHNKYGQSGTGQHNHNRNYTLPHPITFQKYIKQISCGYHHSALLTIDGYLYTMGSNIHGTLGLKNNSPIYINTESTSNLNQIKDINYSFKPMLVSSLKDIDKIFSGAFHMCALKQGQLYTWGKGIDGQLGHGNSKNLFSPMRVQVLGQNVENVSCGVNHTLVIVNFHQENQNNLNGYAFGSGIYGQLGNGSTRNYNTPVKIKLSNIQTVSAGNNHSLFLTKQGKIYGCGDNSYLQLGYSEKDAKNKKNSLQPKRLELFESDFPYDTQNELNFNYLGAGMISVGLTVQGEAYVWGGLNKIFPATKLDQNQDLLDIRIFGDKIYALNHQGHLIQYSHKENNKFQKQFILENKNILDFDVGDNHLMAIGDIVGQVDQVASQVDILEICGNNSHFTSKSISRSVSKRSFVSNLDKNNKVSQQNLAFQDKQNIQQKHPSDSKEQQIMSKLMYLTKNLNSGTSSISEIQSNNSVSHEPQKQQKKIIFLNNDEKKQNKTQKQIQLENQLRKILIAKIRERSKVQNFSEINQEISDIKRNEKDKEYYKSSSIQIENGVSTLNTNQNSQKLHNYDRMRKERQNRQQKQSSIHDQRLDKLMKQMQKRTIHLKKQQISQQSQQEKESQNQQTHINMSANQKQTDEIQISRRHLKSHSVLQISKFKKHQNQEKQNENFQDEHEQKRQLSSRSKDMNLKKQSPPQKGKSKKGQKDAKRGNTSIESIFKQLLRKHHENKQNLQYAVEMKSTSRRQSRQKNQLSKSKKKNLERSQVEPSMINLSRFSPHKNSTQISQQIAIRSTSLQKSSVGAPEPLAISKISTNSIISTSKTMNQKRNPELFEISRSNRQLRSQLRKRDLKISELQQSLSKKQMQVQMLYKKLQEYQILHKVSVNQQK